MRLIEKAVAATLVSAVVGICCATVLSAKSDPAQLSAGPAGLPIETILIMQDAERVARTHAHWASLAVARKY